MSNTTPGPWHAVIAKDAQPSLLYAAVVTTLHYSYDPDGYVAVVADRALGMGEASLLEECQANARLIASAPLMHEALTRALIGPLHQGHCPCSSYATDAIRRTYEDDCLCWVKQARAALQVATPTEPAP